MKDLVPIAEKIAARLIERRQTIAVAESSTGGLISAALLAVPGASAYFLGSAVVYTRDARRILMDIPDDAMKATFRFEIPIEFIGLMVRDARHAALLTMRGKSFAGIRPSPHAEEPLSGVSKDAARFAHFSRNARIN